MTNMLRTFGKKGSGHDRVGDVLKGALAVCIGRWLFHMPARRCRYVAVSGCLSGRYLCSAGPSDPLYFGFKAARACWWQLVPFWPSSRSLPFLFLIFLVCLMPTGMVSLGSVAMAAAYPVLTLIYGSLQGLPPVICWCAPLAPALCPAW